jgi:class 3 adenylate cyclase
MKSTHTGQPNEMLDHFDYLDGNIRDYQGRALIHIACISGDYESVTYLIGTEADLNARDRSGNQPLKYAIMGGHVEIAQILKKNGATLSRKCNLDLEYEMCRCAAEGNLSKVKCLVLCGVSINSIEYEGRSALHLAAANGDIEMVNYLLSVGAVVTIKDRMGREAIDDAAGGGNTQVLEAIIRTMINPSNPVKSRLSDTCLEATDFTIFASTSDMGFFEESGCQNTRSPPGFDEDLIELVKSNKRRAENNDGCYEKYTTTPQYFFAKASRVDSSIRNQDPGEIEGALDRYLATTVQDCPKRNPGKFRKPLHKILPKPHPSELVASCNGRLERLAPSRVEAGHSQSAQHIVLQPTMLPHNPLSQAKSASSSAGSSPHAAPLHLRSCHSTDADAAWGASVKSIRLSAHAAARVTVLLMDIKGFTAACAAMSAGEVGEWVADFYAAVDAAAAAHGVVKAEVRGDCCICVAGLDGQIPLRGAEADSCAGARGFSGGAVADRAEDQVSRVLAFAADVHSSMPATSVRMGVATGGVAMLVGNGGAHGQGFVSVQGEAVALAARMEALAAPGAVLVHRSAACLWAAEGRGARGMPPVGVVACGELGPVEAAAFDCCRRAFLPAVLPGLQLCPRPELAAAWQAMALVGAESTAGHDADYS